MSPAPREPAPVPKQQGPVQDWMVQDPSTRAVPATARLRPAGREPAKAVPARTGFAKTVVASGPARQAPQPQGLRQPEQPVRARPAPAWRVQRPAFRPPERRQSARRPELQRQRMRPAQWSPEPRRRAAGWQGSGQPESRCGAAPRPPISLPDGQPSRRAAPAGTGSQTADCRSHRSADAAPGPLRAAAGGRQRAAERRTG